MTNKLREAAQQALEALELAGNSHGIMLLSDPPQDAWKTRRVNESISAAISALRTALAEQPVEQSANPVGAVFQEPCGYLYPTGRHPEFRFFQKKRDGVDGVPVYTAPQPTEQEPVGMYYTGGTSFWKTLPNKTPLYTAPQPAEQPAEQGPDGLHLVLAGALFDFAGYMTTRSKVIEVGSTANAAPVADLVKEWANLRGLSLDDAAVLSWQEWLSTAPQPAQVVNLTDEQASVIADKMVQAIEAHYRTRGGAI